MSILSPLVSIVDIPSPPAESKSGIGRGGGWTVHGPARLSRPGHKAIPHFEMAKIGCHFHACVSMC